jgi:hypothetical protein
MSKDIFEKNKNKIKKQNEKYPLMEYFFSNKPLEECSRECQKQIEQLTKKEEKELEMIRGESWEHYYADLDIPEGWKNVSYGNDALPSFISDKDDIKGYQIWINSHNEEVKEMNSLDIYGVKKSPRFCVTLCYGYEKDLFQSNNFAEVVEWINNNPKSLEQIEETKRYL